MSEGKDHVETIHLISSSSAVFAFPAQVFSSFFNHSIVNGDFWEFGVSHQLELIFDL